MAGGVNAFPVSLASVSSTCVITRIMPCIDFYIARLRVSPPVIRPLAFLFERRGHETAILCKSINGTSTRCILPSSRRIRLILADKYSPSLHLFLSHTIDSPRLFDPLFIVPSADTSLLVKIMHFLIRRNFLRPRRVCSNDICTIFLFVFYNKIRYCLMKSKITDILLTSEIYSG